MIEAAMVFDKYGWPIHWHQPPGCTEVWIPDSKDLWEVLEENIESLGGLIHTHPGTNEPHPSSEDLTTWAACEAGLGKRLVWPIASMVAVRYFEWVGPGRLDYDDMIVRRFRLTAFDIDHLRDMSRGGHNA